MRRRCTRSGQNAGMEPIPAREARRFVSTRRSTSSSWASAWRDPRPSWLLDRRARRCWPWSVALPRAARRPTLAASSTSEAAPRSSVPAASRTRSTTWRRSSGRPGPGIDEGRVDAYCEGSPEHFDWLVSIGVPFRAAFCDEPNRESADDAGLLFSGGEDSYPFDEMAVPVPRGHKPQYIDSAGGFLMERLGAAVPTSAARVVTDTGADALVVDDGEVVGVRRCGPMTARGPSGLAAGWSWPPAGSSTTRRWWRSSARRPIVPDAGLADRHPERRRPRDPHGRRRRSSDRAASLPSSARCRWGRPTAWPGASWSTGTASVSSTRTPTRVASGCTPCATRADSST